jgi:biopolymer transport protein TolR
VKVSLAGAKLGTISELNMVPLIDILLVLLVIFMEIRPQAQFGLPVDLPEHAEVNPPGLSETIVVQVLGDGTLRINQAPVQWQDLQVRLEEIFSLSASRVAFVRADDALEFGIVARAIDVMRAAGITTVGLMTPEFAIAH